METNKEQYAAPAIEVIEMETQNVIAGSPDAGDNGDPDVKKSAPVNFWE